MAIGAIKLQDAGHRPTQIKEPATIDSEDKIYYPSIHLSTKDVPSLEGYEAGDYVTLVIYGCIKSHSVDENDRGKNEEDFGIDLEKIGVVSKKKKGGSDY